MCVLNYVTVFLVIFGRLPIGSRVANVSKIKQIHMQLFQKTE